MTPVIPVSFIVAASDNDVIGHHGSIPWKQKGDLVFMKKVTMGCPLVMGRKTHESIGRPLPGRRNIVVTHQQIDFPGCDRVSSIEEGIELGKKDNPREVFIFGGSEIYKLALPFTDRIYITRIHTTVEGDTFMPAINWSEWEETEHTDFPADADNENPYTISLFQKRK